MIQDVVTMSITDTSTVNISGCSSEISKGYYKASGATLNHKGNLPYLGLENSGVATLLSGNSAIIVTHGLWATPTKIVVTGTEAETMTLYVDTIGATYFTIHTPESVSSNRTIYWYAEV
jgi:hypothetical protein